jgi:hypothetical protein
MRRIERSVEPLKDFLSDVCSACPKKAFQANQDTFRGFEIQADAVNTPSLREAISVGRKAQAWAQDRSLAIPA